MRSYRLGEETLAILSIYTEKPSTDNVYENYPKDEW